MNDNRKNWKKLNIATKFILLTSTLILITAGVVVLFGVGLEMRHTYQNLLDHGGSVARMMAQNSEFGIYTENYETLKQIANTIEKDNDIIYAAILSAAKKVLAVKQKDQNMTIRTDLYTRDIGEGEILHEEFFNRDNKNYFIDMMVPVVSMQQNEGSDMLFFGAQQGEQRVIGYIQLGLRKAGQANKVQNFLVSTLVVTVLLVFGGIVLTVLMAKRIASPINKLNKAAQKISEGKFNDHIEIRTNDEVSELAESFNHMINRLGDYRHQVEERTIKLSEANEQLMGEISERRTAELALLSAKARLQHLLTASPAVIYSARPSGDFGATFVSDNVRALVDYESSEFTENSKFWISHIHEEDINLVLEKLERSMESGRNTFEYRFRHRNGTYLWLRDDMVVLRNSLGEAVEIIGSLSNVTEQKSLEEQLMHDALHDNLTDLPNRALFTDRLELCFERSKRQKDYRFAVLFIDLDRFKNINDSLGHLSGDQLLKIIAQRLQTCIRFGDTVARLGGDEFALLLEDIEAVSVTGVIAERIHRQMAKPVPLHGQEVFVTASIGIAVSDSSYDRPELILRDADTAMYRAKEKGKACHVIFHNDMHDHAVRYLQIESDLRRALERKELVLYYQPIVSVETGQMIGFEALIRWKHVMLGIIPPNQFVPIAEETGLIVPIGLWVIREACRQIQEWQEKFRLDPPLTVSVNISFKQFTPDLVEQVKQILAETKLPPSQLKMEITESIIMKSPETANEVLRQLQDMQVNILIDDFGTGYSSMNYLHKLPIDALKIDQTFVREIGKNSDSAEIINTITMLAHNLNMHVVVEGVETEEQLRYIRKMKCDYFQGYFFSIPRDPREMEAFLAKKVIRISKLDRILSSEGNQHDNGKKRPAVISEEIICEGFDT